MKFGAVYTKHILEFIHPVRTSRGEMRTHTAYYITLDNDTHVGIGEASPLKGLSIEDVENFEEVLKEVMLSINDGAHPLELDLEKFPSIRFAFETAWQVLENNGIQHHVFNSSFIEGEGIPINGLVWMDNKDSMLKQAKEKIDNGFRCIKFKVGALDFDEECRMLETVRTKYNPYALEIRLDANGAFSNDEAIQQLYELSRFGIHSIEQPIKPNQWDVMEEVCAKSKIDIALDEDLIGLNVNQDGMKMLEQIKPAYIILKPTLIGGFSVSDAWISIAQKLNIGWWATSALESNIGLNAIAQWVATKGVTIPQGLGTGALYKNNIDSPLTAENGLLHYDAMKSWGRIPHEDYGI